MTDGPSPADDETGRGLPGLIDSITDRIDSLQRRVAPIAVVFAVTKKYGEDRGGQLSGLLAYRGFFSLFPLLLALVNGLGLLLAGNVKLREDLIDSVVSNVPVVGSEISTDPTALGGSWAVLVGSVLVSVWAGLGLLEMLQEALNTTWDVALYQRPSFVIRKLRCVPAALVLLLCAALSGAGPTIAALLPEDSNVGRSVFRVALPFIAAGIAYMALHLLLCARRIPVRAQLPGALVCAVGWTVLQLIGGWYVTRFVSRSSDTYGVFVVVLGLLSWAALLGMLYLYSLEVSSVLHMRRWPRSLTGRNLTEADEAAVSAVTRREVRVEGAEVSVDIPTGEMSPDDAPVEAGSEGPVEAASEGEQADDLNAEASPDPPPPEARR